VGAVLSHQFPDGTERPIAYDSRCLAAAEKNYSQLDREGLALIFGVKLFNPYLYGRAFTLRTDHQPLTSLLGENKPIPAMASARIQRWALTLAAYQYTIQFKKGIKNGNADALSRLPLPAQHTGPIPQPAEMAFALELLEHGPIKAQDIKQLTNKDPIPAQVRSWVMIGGQGKR